MLRQAIQGISDLILVPGLINLDFADVKTIMAGMGIAIMGTGVAEGDSRAMDAANAAISSPLLEDASVKGARGVIINVTGGSDLSLIEVSEASAIIQEAAHEDANIIFGAVVDPKMEGRVKITVIATGFDRVAAARQATASSAMTPVDLHSYTAFQALGEDRGLGRRRRRGCRSRGVRCSRCRRRRPRRRRPTRPWKRSAPGPNSSRCRRSTCRRSCGGSSRAGQRRPRRRSARRPAGLPRRQPRPSPEAAAVVD